MNQYDRPWLLMVRCLETSDSRNDSRLVDDVVTASAAPVCMAAYVSLEGNDSVAPPAALMTMSISRLPPRTLKPLTSSGITMGAVRLAAPPACQIQVTSTTPLSARNWVSARPI